MPNPKIAVRKEPVDLALERAGYIGLLLLFILPAYYFGSLPDQVPRHFGADGLPTAWSGKGIVWLLPVIGLITFVKIAILSYFPHIYNYPTTVTAENAERLYRLGSRMMRLLNTILVYIFLYITYGTIHTALGEQDGLHPAFTYALFAGLLLIIGGYVIKMYRTPKTST